MKNTVRVWDERKNEYVDRKVIAGKRTIATPTDDTLEYFTKPDGTSWKRVIGGARMDYRQGREVR